MKKILLCTVCLFVCFCNAYAENSDGMRYDSRTGIIEGVSSEQITIACGDERYILNISDETEFLNSELMPIEMSSLKSGMYICSVNEPMMTMSIPAQIPCDILVASNGQDIPIYTEIGKTDGNSIESADGSLLFYVSEECLTEPFKTKNIVTKNDLSTGDRIFVYTDVLSASMPAKASPSKIVIIENVTDADFDRNITRLEFCEMIYSGGKYTPSAKAPFTDASGDAIDALYGAGIINGMSKTEFAPDEFLTKEQAAVILSRMYSSKAAKAAAYADDSDISDWAKTAVYSVGDLFDGERFMPKIPLTVGQASEILERIK